MRFPLHLPVSVKTDTAEHVGETADISAAGALLALNAELDPGSLIDFTLTMPAGMLGLPEPVKVRCVGRVVRTILEGGRRCTAAIIDEYHFEKVDLAAGEI